MFELTILLSSPGQNEVYVFTDNFLKIQAKILYIRLRMSGKARDCAQTPYTKLKNAIRFFSLFFFFFFSSN